MTHTIAAHALPVGISPPSLMRRLGYPVLVGIAVAGLVMGSILWWSGASAGASIAWGAATIPVLAALLTEIVISLRHADIGLDVIAALSMMAALAFGEPLAANVVALMYAGGQLLERYAEGRARREMTALLGRVARTAMRRRKGGLVEIPINEIVPGDTLVIRQGEVVPVDGHVAPGSQAVLDMSALTGEPLPVSLAAGMDVLSGSTSTGEMFDLIATQTADQSTYAGIVRLVEAAQASKSPMMRLADRYALGFLAFTITLAGLAWLLAGQPERAVAVLVAATPCPLILAVPIAFISGMSKTAASGLLVKSAGDFETLSRVRVAVLDKTGTLTHGSAEISRIDPVDGFTADEVLRLSASLDQASNHVLAAALVRGALARNLVLTAPADVHEIVGSGIEGVVDGRHVLLGGESYVRAHAMDGEHALDAHEGRAAVIVAVAIDGRFAGVVELEDRVRDDAADTIASLRRAGISRLILASGDKPATAEAVGRTIGADETFAGMTPAAKVDVVVAARRWGPTMMVGDGVNDAPALAAADVSVAMGARGSAASSETAGAVMLVDALAPLAAGLATARRTRAVALQSVWVGLGLSSVAMLFAAAGYLPPIGGAILQEAIDVAVILNALRALR